MEKVITSARSILFLVGARWGFLLLLLVSTIALAQAQQPYLLVQGPSKAKTYRFALGETVEWRIKGEDEFFSARMIALYPESQALRLDDILLSINQIAEMRYPRKGQGLRTYLKAQGLFNLVIIGGAVAFDRNVREDQPIFAVGTAFASAAMIGVGFIKPYHTPTFSTSSRYVLKIAGGDLRESDDPNRG